MTDTVTVEKVANTAGEHFANGFHCAEAVVAAVGPNLENINSLSIETAISCATPFGGGLGKSFCEVCGVVSGASIVIGLVHGRHDKEQTWDKPAQLATDFRSHFLNSHGTTHCQSLRERFGEEKQMEECRKLVEQGVVELIKLLQE